LCARPSRRSPKVAPTQALSCIGFEEFQWNAEEFVDAGDQVVVVFRERGRGRGREVELDHHYGTVFTIRDGKIARLEWFDDREAALAAAGF
jgi:ketosteroid isomerase-like protein